jgi:hypothetical protein
LPVVEGWYSLPAKIILAAKMKTSSCKRPVRNIKKISAKDNESLFLSSVKATDKADIIAYIM